MNAEQTWPTEEELEEAEEGEKQRKVPKGKERRQRVGLVTKLKKGLEFHPWYGQSIFLFC